MPVSPLLRPLAQFFRLEAAGGIVLFGAAVLSLVWANSPLAAGHVRLFSSPIALGPLRTMAPIDLQTVVNDGLMSIFFFLVGMEIKRELVSGELRTFRRAVLPGIAAAGGMIVPAAIYTWFNLGGSGAKGWGIPMATDIAFAIGCLTLLGKRVSQGLKVFLLALAIFDDMGGILVIAVFYGHGLHLGWLLAATVITSALWLMNRFRVAAGLAYAGAGLVLWYTVHAAGVHATISGVILGLMIPASPRSSAAADATAPLERFIHGLHPWVAFGIMPLFALANSGVALRDMTMADVAGPVALGASVGLAVGKPVGILAATILAVKLGLADRPGGGSWPAIAAVSIIAGIGFSVAIFIATLAFPQDPALLAQAKLGILAGSLAAGLAGAALLSQCRPCAADA